MEPTSEISGRVILVPTPIGNMGDITLRAIEVLKEANRIACEDTRHSGQLLAHHGISGKPLVSLHEHNEARRAPDDPRVAERFELYACGVELANGFGELTDPVEQRTRFEHEMNEKQRIYGERYPLDEDFLAALEIMPEASGCALGFDRLVMLAAGASRVDQVMWVPVA